MKKELKDKNIMYKKVMQDTEASFCPFRKEFQMEVIENHLGKDLQGRTDVEILEACCGQGRLLYYLNQFDNQQNYTGFDYIESFVDDANELFKQNTNVQCVHGDIFKLPKEMHKKYDITFLYKTLYCIPDYQSALHSLVEITKEKIYITTPLYEGDIDFEIKMQPHKVYKQDDDYAIYYIYALPRIESCLKELGVKSVKFHDLVLPIDLPKPKDLDVLQTYTIRSEDGDNIEINNIIKLDWKLVEIEL